MNVATGATLPATALLERVVRTYPGTPAVQALKSCDLRIDPNDYVAVMGPSGSGKSTLLNLLGLLDVPSGGRYLLDGWDVGHLTEKERAALRGRRLGFVFQSFHLLPHRTSLENVQLGMLYGGVPRTERKQRAQRALGRVGLSHRLDAFPTTLSGGERQRVAIARAIAMNPGLLLCDEPTGNLDSATSQAVLDVMDELYDDGLTVVIVTHDREVAGRATRLFTIQDGLLREAPCPPRSARARPPNDLPHP